MRLLADENVPAGAIVQLRSAGLDVASVPSGASDSVVLDLARSSRRVLLTFDRDFGRLLFQHGASGIRGVIFFRIAPQSPVDPAQTLLRLIDHGVAFEGSFSVIDRNRVRQRPISPRR